MLTVFGRYILKLSAPCHAEPSLDLKCSHVGSELFCSLSRTKFKAHCKNGDRRNVKLQIQETASACLLSMFFARGR